MKIDNFGHYKNTALQRSVNVELVNVVRGPPKHALHLSSTAAWGAIVNNGTDTK